MALIRSIGIALNLKRNSRPWPCRSGIRLRPSTKSRIAARCAVVRCLRSTPGSSIGNRSPLKVARSQSNKRKALSGVANIAPRSGGMSAGRNGWANSRSRRYHVKMHRAINRCAESRARARDSVEESPGVRRTRCCSRALISARSSRSTRCRRSIFLPIALDQKAPVSVASRPQVASRARRRSGESSRKWARGGCAVLP